MGLLKIKSEYYADLLRKEIRDSYIKIYIYETNIYYDIQKRKQEEVSFFKLLTFF